MQREYARVCNEAARIAFDNRCFRKYDLHHRAYYDLRECFTLGSQMVCQAMRNVCAAYKALGRDVPLIHFRADGAVHYDKRTYRIRGNNLSLTTLGPRAVVTLLPGRHQRTYLDVGAIKEAKLIRRKGVWYFNIALDMPEAPERPDDAVMGIDVGENRLACTSTGLMFGGEQTRHECYLHIALRKRLQANGSQSAKQRLKHASGRESRRMSNINHTISRRIGDHAVEEGVGVMGLEDLTHIRNRIKAGKRVRARLHSWAFRQFQDYIVYKAEAAGIDVVFVDPTYTSQTCSRCGALGKRNKHQFSCTCGNRAHADANAASNIARLAASTDAVTGLSNGSECGLH
ncbi:MAG: RNA-guided endonuclease InsQ/TnpB family protein [Gammaproteobacteria bacterium]